MSIPFAVTSVRLWVRCGRAKPTIMRAAAMIGSNQTIPPMRLRVRRATSLARLTSEYSTAATGPRRPRTQIDEWQCEQRPKPLGLKKPDHATGASPVSSTKVRALWNSDSMSATASAVPAT